MLSIQPSSQPTKPLTPNIVPCSIKHSGPIRTSKRHWNPQSSPSSSRSSSSSSANTPTDTLTSSFRGRKLLGKAVALPQGYKGVVLQKTDRIVPTQRQARERMGVYGAEDEGVGDDEEEEEEAEVKIMEQTGSFDKIVVWGHDVLPEEDDAYVKGLKEWIGFAETMHSFDTASADKAS